MPDSALAGRRGDAYLHGIAFQDPLP